MGRDGGNIFEDVPDDLAEERLTELLEAPGLRIERIVSTGQASPPGFWYDQDGAERVLLLAGSAGLLPGARTSRVSSGRATTCSSPRTRTTGWRGPTRGGRRSGWPSSTGSAPRTRQSRQ